MSNNYMEDGSLSEKWKYRFSFYEQHGFPGFWSNSPEYKKAIKALKPRQKITIQLNFIGFFFPWIYLFVLGLWKKAILVLLVFILMLFITVAIGGNIFGIVLNIYVGMFVNKWFYEKEVKGIHTWSL